MALGETGDWDGATARIVNMINGGDDPLEGLLPEGPGSSGLLEAFAREFEVDYGVELGMTIPALAAGLSAATQGGFVAPMVQKLKPKPEFVWTPLVEQFIGIAEAGQSKSTLLNEIVGPLHKALDRVALDERRQLVDKWREAAKADFGSTGLKVDGDTAAWEAVYEGGICPSSTTDQGTPEGIRNALVEQGGHRAILTAEPDVLREISAYTKGNSGGSIGLLLRGWGQEFLSVDRAGTKGLTMREPSLPFLIMVQPESFVKYTGGGDGNDDFVDRGVFSRTWLWRAERTPVLDEFDEDWDPDQVDLSAPMATQLSALREKLESRMTALALRSNEYRVSKGIEQAWAASRNLWMPRPKVVERERLSFDGNAGIHMHVKVQRMRAALRRAVAEANALSPGQATVLDPMAVRFTDHVMRLAALSSLADDPGCTAVDTAHIEDVATRLVPWLWSGWWRVMRERLEENSRTYMAESLLKNTKGKDLTGGGALRSAMAKLAEDGPAGMLGGHTPSEIFKVVRSRMPKAMRAGITEHLRQELEALVAEKHAEKIKYGENAANLPLYRYRLTMAGVQAAKADGG